MESICESLYDELDRSEDNINTQNFNFKFDGNIFLFFIVFGYTDILVLIYYKKLDFQGIFRDSLSSSTIYIIKVNTNIYYTLVSL